MLKGDFFNILQLENTGGVISAMTVLVPDHSIYAGHFPEKPIVPGVCQVGIVIAVAEEALGGPLLMKEMNICKFIRMMDPSTVKELRCRIHWLQADAENFSFSGELSGESCTYLKIKGILSRWHG